MNQQRNYETSSQNQGNVFARGEPWAQSRPSEYKEQVSASVKSPILMANNNAFSIGPYKQRKDASRVSVLEKYEIIGYIAAGTYGKVYKANAKAHRDKQFLTADNEQMCLQKDLIMVDHGKESEIRNKEVLSNSLSRCDSSMKDGSRKEQGNHQSRSYASSTPSHTLIMTQYYAIKKFKTDKEDGEQLHYTGISQSACREMALCRELNNNHLTKLVEIFLERKSIYMVSEFAEHDLLQIIHFHSHPEKRLIPPRMLKSILWQILDGVSYLHQNWILHRDLKPANIMVTVDGCVKIGDLGLARKFHNLVQTLYTGDKVVVTIWYRAPELLLGARHYTPAIDLWAVGCIFAELIGLRPLFKGEEAKMDSKKIVPFQSNQFQRILEVLGMPNNKNWPNINRYPEYEQISKFPNYTDNLTTWYHSSGGRDKDALDLLYNLLRYDPLARIDAIDALEHRYFTNGNPLVCENVFHGLNYKYPPRRIHTNDNDIMNIGTTKLKSVNIHRQQVISGNNIQNNDISRLGINRHISTAVTASGNGDNIQISNQNGPLRKKKK